MIISELWIGDLLKLKKSGRIGKFAGISQEQKVKVNIGGKIVLTTPGNLEHAPDNHSDSNVDFIPRPTIIKQEPKALSNVIDLHLEVLNPSMINARPERIIDYQVKSAQDFIEISIKQNTKKVEIIHGKGEGVLKSEVLHLLSLYDEVNFIFDKNRGGSSEVWFK